jgi:hypothetical protein
MAQIIECSDNSVVSPIGVLLGHADDQGFGCSVDGWSARIRTFLGAVELACDETTVPGQDRVGLSNTGHLLKFLAPGSLADFREGRPLRIREPHSQVRVEPQNPVLSGQVFILEEVADSPDL